MDRDEWQAWTENPITLLVKDLLRAKADEYSQTRVDPRGLSPTEFWQVSLELTAKAESYTAILDSLQDDAFDDIFGED